MGGGLMHTNGLFSIQTARDVYRKWRFLYMSVDFRQFLVVLMCERIQGASRRTRRDRVLSQAKRPATQPPRRHGVGRIPPVVAAPCTGDCPWCVDSYCTSVHKRVPHLGTGLAEHVVCTVACGCDEAMSALVAEKNLSTSEMKHAACRIVWRIVSEIWEKQSCFSVGFIMSKQS